jgi:trigger factor
MSATLEKISDNTAHINIEVEDSVFEEGINKAYVKNAKHFAIPGFRKGKAPRKLIEQYYGESIFYEDAINILLPEVYENAINELKLEPVDKPDVEIKQIGGNGENLVINAKVTLKPEVKLGDYKGIELKKVEYNVSDEDVDNEINSYRERNARIITIEDRPIAKDDIVTIDFKGYKDGEAFPDGEGSEYELTIGSGQFIPGFEEQLIGCTAGSETKVNVTFPEDYHAEDLKGAKAEFEVKIHSIKVKELPELDDEFAKDVSEFDTFEEFKNDIKSKLVEQAENRQKSQLENEAVNKAAEKAEVDIPKCMIDTQIETMLRDYEMRLRQQGLSLDNYLEITQNKMEDLKAQFAEQAQNQVKASLTLEQISKQEAIEVSEQEVEEEISKLAELYKLPVENVKKFISPDDIKNDIKTRKAVEIIVASAVIK